MIVQFIFGWPAILLFMSIATLAAWRNSYVLMALALAVSLPSTLYLFGGNGWIQLVAFYIPISLGVSVVLIRKRIRLAPKLLLLPIYGFYAYLGYAVVAQ